MTHKIFLFIAASFVSLHIFAQTPPTIQKNQEESETAYVNQTDIVEISQYAKNYIKDYNTDTLIHAKFNSNLDKLINIWYIKNSKYWKYVNRPAKGFKVGEVPNYEPDVYKTRISQMNSIIPLSYNVQVQSFINLYAFRRRNQVEIMMGLSEYYFPMFEEVLEQNNVPQELKYLAIIESALNPRATSPVGAGGLWQFMPATGKIYNMNITSYVDERRDPIKATHSAAKYLSTLHGMFNDWLLAIAAYNCGPGNVRKAIARSGGKRTFWEIYPYLPKETRGYVPAFIAAYYVFEHHKEHNLYPRDINFPPIVDTLIIKNRLHLGQISEMLKVEKEMLQDINPHLRADIIPYNEKGNTLYLPIEYIVPFLMMQNDIYKYKDNEFFNNALIDQAPATGPVQAATTKSQRTKVYYTVKKGDKIENIAKWYHVSVYEIRAWNKLKKKPLKAGRKLLVFVPAEHKSEYARVASMSYADKQNFAKQTLKPIEKPKQTTDTAAQDSTKTTKVEQQQKPKQLEREREPQDKNQAVYHKVKKGESLYKISVKYNVPMQQIQKLNKLNKKSQIQAGTRLRIK